MKTLAGKLLEKLNEVDAAPGSKLLPDMPKPAGDMGPAADAPVPAASQPEMGKVLEAMDCPDKMAGMLEAMADKCGAYFDEADDSTYTCKDMQEKDDVEMAMQGMKEAAMKMKGKKK